MLEHSKAALGIIADDLKRWSKILKIAFSIFTLAYYIYAFTSSIGIVYVNAALLVLYAVYTVFELSTCGRRVKRAKKIYKWASLLLKAVTLASTLYGIYIAAENVNGITVILAILSLVIWIFQAFVELIILVLEPRLSMLATGIILDFPALNGNSFLGSMANEKHEELLKERAELIKETKPKKSVFSLLKILRKK